MCKVFLVLLQTLKSCTFQEEVLELLMLNSGMYCKALGEAAGRLWCLSGLVI